MYNYFNSNVFYAMDRICLIRNRRKTLYPLLDISTCQNATSFEFERKDCLCFCNFLVEGWMGEKTLNEMFPLGSSIRLKRSIGWLPELLSHADCAGLVWLLFFGQDITYVPGNNNQVVFALHWWKDYPVSTGIAWVIVGFASVLPDWSNRVNYLRRLHKNVLWLNNKIGLKANETTTLPRLWRTFEDDWNAGQSCMDIFLVGCVGEFCSTGKANEIETFSIPATKSNQEINQHDRQSSKLKLWTQYKTNDIRKLNSGLRSTIILTIWIRRVEHELYGVNLRKFGDSLFTLHTFLNLLLNISSGVVSR